MSEKIINVDISHLLKVDPFAQQYTVKKSYDMVGRKLVESNEDFFTFIYVEPNNSIKINGVVYQKNTFLNGLIKAFWGMKIAFY